MPSRLLERSLVILALCAAARPALADAAPYFGDSPSDLLIPLGVGGGLVVALILWLRSRRAKRRGDSEL